MIVRLMIPQESRSREHRSAQRGMINQRSAFIAADGIDTLFDVKTDDPPSGGSSVFTYRRDSTDFIVTKVLEQNAPALKKGLPFPDGRGSPFLPGQWRADRIDPEIVDPAGKSRPNWSSACSYARPTFPKKRGLKFLNHTGCRCQIARIEIDKFHRLMYSLQKAEV